MIFIFFPDKGSLFISDLSMTIFRRLQPGTPLDGNDGMFIVEDREKWLWLGTNNGLFRYDKKDHFISYNFVDGIPSSIFTLCPPVRDENGILVWKLQRASVFGYSADESEEIRSLFGCHNRYMCKWKICSAICCGRWRQE